MLSPKGKNVLIHIGGWLLFLVLILAFVMTSRGGPALPGRIFEFPLLLFFAVYLFLFYFNALLLFPGLYLRKQYLYYFLITVLLLAGIGWLKPFDNLLNMHPPRFEGPFPSAAFDRPEIPRFPGGPHKGPKIDIVSFVLFLMIWSLGSAWQILKQWRTTEQRAAHAETERVNAELSFLKAQIHPHFLFNTLNNIYSLSVSNSAETSVAILKLSNILRYITDEAAAHFVSLASEVKCAADYIDLQRLRLNDKAAIDFTVKGTMEGKEIAPLLLMTFIENVFKYGISSHEASPVTIEIVAEEKSIFFFCRNRIFKTDNEPGRRGVGISNTRKRLEHLYPYRHVLRINSENGIYTVQLTLQA